MANGPILIREQRYHQIKAVLARLRLDASARLVVLVDKDGQQIAVHGELGELTRPVWPLWRPVTLPLRAAWPS